MRGLNFLRPAVVWCMVGMAVFMGMATVAYAGQEYKSGIEWPEPKVVTPGDAPGAPPSDATVLFDGKDLSEWVGAENWVVENGYAISNESTIPDNRTLIQTKRSFGDCQLHLEWASPAEVSGEGQGRGNSGVFMMGRYEIQVLDSYENKTYFDGQAGSIYKQTPPLVNACRKPGEWQTYDVIFTAPRFSRENKLEKPAYITLLHNGVLVLNHFEIKGDTPFTRPPSYEAHADRLPLGLQWHHNPVRFRNIWIREIPAIEPISISPPYFIEHTNANAAKAKAKKADGAKTGKKGSKRKNKKKPAQSE